MEADGAHGHICSYIRYIRKLEYIYVVHALIKLERDIELISSLSSVIRRPP